MNKFFKKTKKENESKTGLILDTCALIDGRIVDIANAGFLPEHIIIPTFIIAELQYLADQGDSQKRERARFGLDVVRTLQEHPKLKVTISREQFSKIREVDSKLIALAKSCKSPLYTTDFNLNKVAQIEGVKVLNVNELAQALRPPRLPGEKHEIKITAQGQDKTQGVGYLDDGTMVVVEKAGNRVGQKVWVEFSRILQTQAGKMMFAIMKDQPKRFDQPTHPQKQHGSRDQNKKHQNNQKRHPKQRPPKRPDSPEDRLIRLANE